MSSRIADDRILVNCFVGCLVDDICAALGWKTSALFVKKAPATSNPQTPSSRPKEDPDPLPTEDDLRMGRDRLARADIRMRLTTERDWSPSALTEFRLGLDANGRIEIPFYKGDELVNVERYVPFETSELKMFAPKGRPRELLLPPGGLQPEVFITEGRSDAIAACSHGLAAVGVPSAGTWKQSYTKAIETGGVKTAYVVSDCDRAGRKHAFRVAKSLDEAGIAAFVVDLDPAHEDGFDLTDYLKTGSHGNEELRQELVQLGKPYVPAPAEQEGVGEFEVIAPSLDEVRPIDWAWRDRLVMGLVNLLVGEEGAGKGTLIAWLAAKLTRGELDGDLLGRPVRVLIMGDEDDFHRVWTPRLHVANADFAMVGCLKGKFGSTLTFPSGIPKLREVVSARGTEVVICDQILDNLDPEINPDNARDVRRALMPLRAFAEEMSIAVIAAAHTNKSRGGSFRQSVSGSHAFNAVSKSSLLVAPHPDGPEERRVVARGKGNYTKRPASLEFTIQSRSPKIGGHSIQTSLAADFQDSPLTADDLLAPRKREPTSKMGRARDYIREALADGESHDAKPISEYVETELGMGDRQIRLAREKVGAVSEKKPEFQGASAWRLTNRPLENFIRTSRTSRYGEAPTEAKAAKPAKEAESDQIASGEQG